MAILDRFRKKEEVTKEEKEQGVKIKVKHVAITTEGVIKWAGENDKGLLEAFKQSNLIIKNAIKTQIRLKIPILTLYLLPAGVKNLEHFSIIIDSLVELFDELCESEIIQTNRVKISAFGKWYDLPGRVVEPLKGLLEFTKDYDDFFVNLCINYDGQEEIVDACKIVAMQLKTEKIELDLINKATIKDNIYASDFLPPDLIIKNGLDQRLNGLLLWDSLRTTFYFTKKLWPEFGKSDFERAVEEFEKRKI